MSGHVVTWNGVSSVTIPELVCGKITRKLLGSHRGTFLEVPGRDSAWYFSEERGRREITIECHVMATTFAARRDAVTAVADWLDINQQAELTLGDESGVYYQAVLLEPPDVNEWREAGVFDLIFSAEAYSYAATVTELLVPMVDGVADSADFDLLAPVYPVIEVTPTNGTSSTGFVLTVGTDVLVYTGITAMGATVTINGVALVVLAGTNDDTNLTGVYDPVFSLMGAVSGQFPVLLPGAGQFLSITSTGTSTEFDVNFIYRKRYRR